MPKRNNLEEKFRDKVNNNVSIYTKVKNLEELVIQLAKKIDILENKNK